MNVYIGEKALAAARAHASSDIREVCGVCFGRVWQTADGALVVQMGECWPAPHAQSAHAGVAFTVESWAAVHDHLDALREASPQCGWRIVGWYHSHPGFGIFLSGTDLHTHRTYFPQPWHIALVVDPRSRSEGIFCWTGKGGEVVRGRLMMAPESAKDISGKEADQIK